MPRPSGNPGRVVHGGEFFSPVVARESREHVLLAELRQPTQCQTPRHEHALAYLTVVLAGNYAEYESTRTFELGAFKAIFNPSGVIHSGAFGGIGAALFTIELRPEYLRRLGVTLASRPEVDSGTGSLLWPGLRIYSAFKRELADSLTLDSHLLELVAAVSGAEKSPQLAPPWLRRVCELLHEGFRGTVSIENLAAEAGVHPVHLARVFRAQLGQTAGDYLRRLRLRAACHLLRDQEMPLAMVAAECGFADQSHLTRMFKRLVGTTPGHFREMQSDF